MLVVTLRLSPWHNSCRFLPSKETQAVFLLSGDTEIFSSTPAGTTIGLQNSYDACTMKYGVSKVGPIKKPGVT